MLRGCDPRIGFLYANAPEVLPPQGYVAAPPLEMVLAGMALLQLGQAGAMIIVLQQLLNQQLNASLGAGGLFDESTQNAVQQFQRGQNFEPNGLVDAALLIALLSQGMDRRNNGSPMSRMAPRFGASCPDGAQPAYRYIQADASRRASSKGAAPVAAPQDAQGAGALGQRVLLLGDSHTVGEFGKSLESQLTADGRSVTRHAMVGASALTHVAGVGEQIRQSNPDSIVIALGANFRGASQAQIKTQIDRLLGEVQANGSQANIVWVGPPKSRADGEDGGASLRRFDAMMSTELDRAAASRGMSARYVSSAPVTSYDGPDGVHYNPGAARAWSESIHGAIAAQPANPADPKNALPAGGDAPRAGDVTPEELRRIAPNLDQTRAEELTPHLNRAMHEANITTERQRAAFIAQLSAESGGFRYFEEIASGDAYEGRAGLGNTEPGDGRRFKGRGPIQLTGRSNYRAAGRALGLDLENHPEQVATPEVGFRVAAWFWSSRNLNEYAERGDFREVTRRINGGYNGLSARTAYYDRALTVLA